MNKNAWKSYVPIFLSLIVTGGCSDITGTGVGIAGGGITGTGTGIADGVIPGPSTGIAEYSSYVSVPGTEEGFRDRSDIIKCDQFVMPLSPPDDLQGMWENVNVGAIMALSEYVAFETTESEFTFNATEDLVSNESFTESAYLFDFQRSNSCQISANVSIARSETNDVTISISGTDSFSVQLERSSPSSFIRPPERILGKWEHLPLLGDPVVFREFSQNEIIVSDGVGESVSLSTLLALDDTFFTTVNDDLSYRYQFTTEDTLGNTVLVIEEFEFISENELFYTVEINGDKFLYTLIRVDE